jgi:hypothetical protein
VLRPELSPEARPPHDYDPGPKAPTYRQNSNDGYLNRPQICVKRLVGVLSQKPNKIIIQYRRVTGKPNNSFGSELSAIPENSRLSHPFPHDFRPTASDKYTAKLRLFRGTT